MDCHSMCLEHCSLDWYGKCALGFGAEMKNMGVIYEASSASLVRELEQLDGMSSSVSSVACAIITTRHTRRFEGDDWKCVLEKHMEALCSAFVTEAAIACHVDPGDISELEFRLGSLYVTFHVSHDADVGESEIQERVELYPFREVMRLYANRDAPPSGLDAALKRISELEKEVKQRLEKVQEENASKVAELEDAKRQLEEKLLRQLHDREQVLGDALSKAQEALQGSEAENRRLEEEMKKALETIKRERKRLDKHALHQNELIAAIIQGNRKEMEAKEREFEENLLEKDVIIENLRVRLRSKTESANCETVSRAASVDTDRADEFAKLMGRMEEMAIVLEKTQESESEARGEIQRLSEALRLSEEARQSDAVIYENNVLALKQQLQAFRDTKLAEDHQKRQEEYRARRSTNLSKEEKTNETIVRQYETALENIIGTLQDRLTILREEYASFLKVSEEETVNERDVLNEHEQDSQQVRQKFRTASLTLQRVFWSTREKEVPDVISELDNAAASAEKSRAAVKVTLALLDSRLQSFSEQKEWMETHQQSLEDLLVSLRQLNKRAFARQLSLMNEQSARFFSTP
ncbi:kinesin-like protein [Trypanosoma rangeli]|uniref:Kinesin-like protein n=1 Tax=Trypanosoma rangeli TaxID=5698 RepID=A0A422N8F5_TRYRA|nr:kinesin-like protein [Trypanosoma rangeli]RNF01737.1 kinesin-like protein [Trypanosoma rangeli]|eukprot:RNF01737.1 kinesin-like protein [Trypanosoma rangeli]